MLRLAQAMLDAVLVAGPVEDVMKGVFVAGMVGDRSARCGWCRGPLRRGCAGTGRRSSCRPPDAVRRTRACWCSRSPRTGVVCARRSALRRLAAGNLGQAADVAALEAAVQRRSRLARAAARVVKRLRAVGVEPWIKPAAGPIARSFVAAIHCSINPAASNAEFSLPQERNHCPLSSCHS